jgi:hypothetical protein
MSTECRPKAPDILECSQNAKAPNIRSVVPASSHYYYMQAAQIRPDIIRV